MEKINYDRKYKEIISTFNDKPKLLLHACCGPCSSYVLEYLSNNFEITVLFYNPNIYPEEEYLKRKNELLKLIKLMNKSNISYEDIDYLSNEYDEKIINLENEPEGGKRCYECIYLRLQKTAILAKEGSFEYFCTTLTVSPHKNAEMINRIGEELSKEYDIKYLYSDFKKNEGFKKSIENSKKYDLYRQNYCGCKYSMRKEENE